MKIKIIIYLILFLITTSLVVADLITTTTGTNNEDYWGYSVSGAYIPIQSFKLGTSGTNYSITGIIPNVQGSPSGSSINKYIQIRDGNTLSDSLICTSNMYVANDFSSGFVKNVTFSSCTIDGDTEYFAHFVASSYGSELVFLERNSASNDYADGASGAYYSGTYHSVLYDIGIKIYYTSDGSPPAPDPCTYSGFGQWNINANCTITEDTNKGTNDLIIGGHNTVLIGTGVTII